MPNPPAHFSYVHVFHTLMQVRRPQTMLFTDDTLLTSRSYQTEGPATHLTTYVWYGPYGPMDTYHRPMCSVYSMELQVAFKFLVKHHLPEKGHTESLSVFVHAGSAL